MTEDEDEAEVPHTKKRRTSGSCEAESQTPQEQPPSPNDNGTTELARGHELPAARPLAACVDNVTPSLGADGEVAGSDQGSAAIPTESSLQPPLMISSTLERSMTTAEIYYVDTDARCWTQLVSEEVAILPSPRLESFSHPGKDIPFLKVRLKLAAQNATSDDRSTARRYGEKRRDASGGGRTCGFHGCQLPGRHAGICQPPAAHYPRPRAPPERLAESMMNPAYFQLPSTNSKRASPPVPGPSKRPKDSMGANSAPAESVGTVAHDECPICEYPWDLTDHMPYNILCHGGHSICQKCLPYLKKGECPMCKEVLVEGKYSAKNRALISHLELASQLNKAFAASPSQAPAPEVGAAAFQEHE